MTAFVFAITQRETGALRAAAVVCPEARYASILWREVDRIDRKFFLVTQWKAVLAQLGDTLPPGPLPEASALVAAIGLDRGYVIKYVSREPVADELDGRVLVPALDRRLQDARTW